MEAVRRKVDSWLLQFLQSQNFTSHDFFERPDGVVRVTGNITPLLAETAPQWAKEMAPIVERLAQTLYQWGRRKNRPEGTAKPELLPTKLSQANRSAGRDGIRRRSIQPDRPLAPKAPNACRECGVILENDNEQFCTESCRRSYEKVVGIAYYEEAGLTALAKLRSEGNDPAHGGEAGKKRGQSNADRVRQKKEWEAMHGDGRREREMFKAEILPRISDVPLSQIMEATGLSIRYASLIRRGLYTPHPVHYSALRRLTR